MTSNRLLPRKLPSLRASIGCRVVLVASCFTVGIAMSQQARAADVPVPLSTGTDARTAWLSHGRDYSNQRFSPLAEITRETIKRLEIGRASCRERV